VATAEGRRGGCRAGARRRRSARPPTAAAPVKSATKAEACVAASSAAVSCWTTRLRRSGPGHRPRAARPGSRRRRRVGRPVDGRGHHRPRASNRSRPLMTPSHNLLRHGAVLHVGAGHRQHGAVQAGHDPLERGLVPGTQALKQRCLGGGGVRAFEGDPGHVPPNLPAGHGRSPPVYAAVTSTSTRPSCTAATSAATASASSPASDSRLESPWWEAMWTRRTPFS
jgi:hypothetical protein